MDNEKTSTKSNAYFDQLVLFGISTNDAVFLV